MEINEPGILEVTRFENTVISIVITVMAKAR